MRLAYFEALNWLEVCHLIYINCATIVECRHYNRMAQHDLLSLSNLLSILVHYLSIELFLVCARHWYGEPHEFLLETISVQFHGRFHAVQLHILSTSIRQSELRWILYNKWNNAYELILILIIVYFYFLKFIHFSHSSPNQTDYIKKEFFNDWKRNADKSFRIYCSGCFCSCWDFRQSKFIN